MTKLRAILETVIGLLMILLLIKMLKTNKLICKPIYQDNMEVLQCQYK